MRELTPFLSGAEESDMAFHGPIIFATGCKAGADLSAAGNQYKFVKLSAVNTVVLCAATTDKPYGILYNTPANGAAAEVAVFGQCKVQGDANLAPGDSVGTSADGQAAAYTASDTTKYIVGVVQEDNSAAGGIATIMFYGPGRTLA